MSTTGRVVFRNPNNPAQPAKGVYRWFFRNGNAKKTLYVGEAGRKGRRKAPIPSTLLRGAQEASRSAGISSDKKGKTLDTDFIVGTAIKYLTTRGADCVWEHVSDDPGDEGKVSARLCPLLQDGLKIKGRFKCKRVGDDRWNDDQVQKAEEILNRELEKTFPSRGVAEPPHREW